MATTAKTRRWLALLVGGFASLATAFGIFLSVRPSPPAWRSVREVPPPTELPCADDSGCPATAWCTRAASEGLCVPRPAPTYSVVGAPAYRVLPHAFFQPPGHLASHGWILESPADLAAARTRLGLPETALAGIDFTQGTVLAMVTALLFDWEVGRIDRDGESVSVRLQGRPLDYELKKSYEAAGYTHALLALQTPGPVSSVAFLEMTGTAALARASKPVALSAAALPQLFGRSRSRPGASLTVSPLYAVAHEPVTVRYSAPGSSGCYRQSRAELTQTARRLVHAYDVWSEGAACTQAERGGGFAATFVPAGSGVFLGEVRVGRQLAASYVLRVLASAEERDQALGRDVDKLEDEELLDVVAQASPEGDPQLIGRVAHMLLGRFEDGDSARRLKSDATLQWVRKAHKDHPGPCGYREP